MNQAKLTLLITSLAPAGAFVTPLHASSSVRRATSPTPDDDLMGVIAEEVMLDEAKDKQGQSSWKIDVAESADPFGYADEERTRAAVASRSAAPTDVYGIGEEERMLASARAGQNSFEGAIDVKEADPFGFNDELVTTQEQRARGAATLDPFGFASAPAPTVAVSFVDGIAAPRKMSLAIPFVERPALLDEISLAGDCGFDPLGLSDSRERLLFMRDAEIKHARLAMLAVVGWPLSELLHPALASDLGAPSIVTKLAGDAPSVLNGGLDLVPAPFWVAAIVAAAVLELQGTQASASGKLPGDLGWRAGSGAATALCGSAAKVADAELANGRLAMLAIVGFAAQEFAARASGIPIPVISQTPFFFHSPF